MLHRLIIAFSLAATPSFAQQQQAPLEQRIAAQLGSLMIQNASLSVQVEQMAAEVSKLKTEAETLKTRIKELEAKK